MEYVIAVGSACLDEYYRVDEWIPEGGKASVYKLEPIIGGMIANAASVLAQIGVKTYLVDVVNPMFNSTKLIENDLRKYGVDTSHMIYNDKAEEGKCMIFLTEKERSLFSVATEKKIIDPFQNIDFYSGARFIYSQFSDFARIKDISSFVDALDISGTGLVFDVEKYTGSQLEKIMLENAEIIFFNEYGAADYYAVDGNDSIQELLQTKAKVVVVTEGIKGCMLYLKNQSFHIPAYQVDITDTTGAGDTFNAAFLSQICCGAGYEEAAKYATAAAALCIGYLGAKSLSLTPNKIEAFIKENSWR